MYDKVYLRFIAIHKRTGDRYYHHNHPLGLYDTEVGLKKALAYYGNEKSYDIKPVRVTVEEIEE